MGATDVPADVEPHTSLEVVAPLLDNEDRNGVTDAPSEPHVDDAVIRGAVQPQDATEPADVLAAVTSAVYPQPSLGSEALVVVPDSLDQAVSVVARKAPSDEPTVPSVPEVLADQNLNVNSARFCASDASAAILAIPVGYVPNTCDMEPSGDPQCGTGLAATGSPEGDPATIESAVGGELSAPMDEDVAPQDVSNSSAEEMLDNDRTILADVVLPEASPATNFSAPTTQEPKASSSEYCMAIRDTDGDQLMHSVDFITKDHQELDDVEVSDCSTESDVLVGPLAAANDADLENALNSPIEDFNSPIGPIDDDPAMMQIDEEQPSDDLGVAHIVEDCRAMSPPLPPSSPPYLSSPMRSSSPPFMFSSPPSQAFNSSLPTSPAPSPPRRKPVAYQLDEEPTFRNEEAGDSTRRKRALGDIDETDGTESGLLTSSKYTPMSDERDMKRVVSLLQVCSPLAD